MPAPGSAWLAGVHPAAVTKRSAAPDCTPHYTPVTTCTPTGTQRVGRIKERQTNCPHLPEFRERDCPLPVKCYGRDLDLPPGVVTCGYCDVVDEGTTCFFGCADQRLSLRGPHKATCLGTGDWSGVDVHPQCGVFQPTCPNIVPRGGMSVVLRPGISVCTGAVAGQQCEISCLPGYYNVNSWVTIQCESTPDGKSAFWNHDPTDACQQQCCGTGEHCTNTTPVNLYNLVYA